MRNYIDVGLQVPQIFLPREGIDLSRWAVIACDQYTSQPEYWNKVESMVGDSPSTLRLTLPEIYLESPDVSERIHNVQLSMKQYLKDGTLESSEGFVYVERTIGNKTRKGIVAAIDLEQYDFSKGSSSLVRATEGTIVDRLPPRIRIRQDAPLELPHILVLIDDPENQVIGPLTENKSSLEMVYDFDLMLGSGHLTGRQINRMELETGLVNALRNLARRDVFSARYGVAGDEPVLLYAMGDGNHSLATAKAIWEKARPLVGMDHPSRYALVEIENVHDDALEFEPIHRVLFHVSQDFKTGLKEEFPASVEITSVDSAEEMIRKVDSIGSDYQLIGLVESEAFSIIKFKKPTSNLAVGTIQPFLDQFLKKGAAERIDYVHGADVTVDLGTQKGNLGIYLPGMHKSDLFKTVIKDGALPRKTFSMGEAHEKRFYMEARKIA